MNRGVKRSFDNARYQIETIFGRRGNLLEGFALVNFGDLIGAQALNGVQGMCQWFYVGGIGRLQLIHKIQDVAKVFFKRFNLIVFKPDARKHGDFFDVLAGY
tara:strand:- start:58646 stop:58951 length:306 start_codon:yes stop_codon:yes gene_type:complete